MESRLSTMEERRGSMFADFTKDEDDVDEEHHFRRLYDRVLENFLKRMNNSKFIMHSAISFIMDSFRWRDGRNFSDIDFERNDNVHGYIFRYGPHGAGLTRFRTLEALENCRTLRHILKKPRLNVASLGGGPGNDAVGFCSALGRCQFTGSLHIDVVDPAWGWVHSIFAAVNLLRSGSYGDASELFQKGNVDFAFAPFSVPDQLWELPMSSIDVFLICKLVSILSWEDKRNLVQKLYLRMKESAVILLIDSPFSDDLWCDNFDILYLSDADQPYRSSAIVERYGHNDGVTSYARIAVMRKKRQLFS